MNFEDCLHYILNHQESFNCYAHGTNGYLYFAADPRTNYLVFHLRPVHGCVICTLRVIYAGVNQAAIQDYCVEANGWHQAGRDLIYQDEYEIAVASSKQLHERIDAIYNTLKCAGIIDEICRRLNSANL